MCVVCELDELGDLGKGNGQHQPLSSACALSPCPHPSHSPSMLMSFPLVLPQSCCCLACCTGSEGRSPSGWLYGSSSPHEGRPKGFAGSRILVGGLRAWASIFWRQGRPSKSCAVSALVGSYGFATAVPVSGLFWVPEKDGLGEGPW